MARGILVTLRTMGHCAPDNLLRLRKALRQQLQNFVDVVMDAAPEAPQ
jgi:hypothetical protein